MDQSMAIPDSIKLFNFLDSETIATMKWIEKYLSKQGVFLEQELFRSEQVKFALANYFLSNNTPPSDIKLFAKKMGNAWRIRKHRQNKNIGTLSLSLDKAVLAQLNRMCHGQKKAEIISLLINGGYEEFLKYKAVEKAKLKEQKRIKEMAQENMKFDKLLKKKQTQAVEELESIKALQTQNDLLKRDLATLYDLIFSANEEGSTIDDQNLLQATKLYYNAFNK